MSAMRTVGAPSEHRHATSAPGSVTVPACSPERWASDASGNFSRMGPNVRRTPLTPSPRRLGGQRRWRSGVSPARRHTRQEANRRPRARRVGTRYKWPPPTSRRTLAQRSVSRRPRLWRRHPLGGGFEREVARRCLDDLTGRGLLIVDALSSRWEIHEGTTHVWFELASDAPSAPTEPQLGTPNVLPAWTDLTAQTAPELVVRPCK